MVTESLDFVQLTLCSDDDVLCVTDDILLSTCRRHSRSCCTCNHAFIPGVSPKGIIPMHFLYVSDCTAWFRRSWYSSECIYERTLARLILKLDGQETARCEAVFSTLPRVRFRLFCVRFTARLWSSGCATHAAKARCARVLQEKESPPKVRTKEHSRPPTPELCRHRIGQEQMKLRRAWPTHMGLYLRPIQVSDAHVRHGRALRRALRFRLVSL